MPSRTPITPERFRPENFPRRINMGAGGDYREGYLNLDLNAWYEPDVVADARDLAFLPANHYDEIIAQDVLEHLPRTQTLRTLQVWNRVLRPGGRLWLRVPSVEGLVALMQRPEFVNAQKHEELMQCLFGTQAYTGDFHYTSFTEVLLRHYLEAAGFETREVVLNNHWLFDVTAAKVGHLAAPTVRDWADLAATAGDEAFLDACYRQILERAPDASGRAFFLDGLRRGMDRATVIETMLGGPEYKALQQRKGP